MSNTGNSWLAIWEGPENPTSFMKAVVKNTNCVLTWKEESRIGKLLNHPINLSNLFNPTIFLNALRQVTARKSINRVCLHHIVSKPIDSLELCSTWNASEIKNSPIRCQVEGLILQGCGFDGSKLTELDTDDPTYSSVPLCNLAWIPQVLLQSLFNIFVA